MIRRLCLFASLWVAVAPLVMAQPNRRGGGEMSIKSGMMLPEVSAYDEQGNRFSTSSLKGSYTVLVFGCLT